MPVQITMPQLSDTMTEGTLIKWNKNVGDKVQAGEEIADVETDKATMPMEAFEAGTLAAILVQAGQKVKVGEVLAVIATAGEDVDKVKKEAGQSGPAPAAPSAPASAAPAAEKPAAQDSETPSPAARERERTESRRMHVGVEATETSEQLALQASQTIEHRAHPGHQPEDGGRVRVSPLARRIAKDRGIDLRQMTGTGPAGRIVKRDIEQALETPQAAPAAGSKPAPSAAPMAQVSAGTKKVVPLSKMRLTIATRLQQSTQTIPHFYEMVDVDCEPMLALRQRLNDLLEKENVRLSLADFLHRGVAVALGRHPVLNSTFNGSEIAMHGNVNLGIAVALEQGLIVPVLRGAQNLGLRELRVRTAELVERARVMRLKQDELSGATFTVSNLGTYGIREFTAIINPPEVAILAVGSAGKRAVVVDDQIVARTVMTLTLSSDHRVVDGAAAADFLRTLKGLLEEPGLMLL